MYVLINLTLLKKRSPAELPHGESNSKVVACAVAPSQLVTRTHTLAHADFPSVLVAHVAHARAREGARRE